MKEEKLEYKEDELFEEIIIEASIFADKTPQNTNLESIPIEIIEPPIDFPINTSFCYESKNEDNMIDITITKEFVDSFSEVSALVKDLPFNPKSTKFLDSELHIKKNSPAIDTFYDTKVTIPLTKLIPIKPNQIQKMQTASEECSKVIGEENKYAKYCSNFISRVIFG